MTEQLEVGRPFGAAIGRPPVVFDRTRVLELLHRYLPVRLLVPQRGGGPLRDHVPL